MPRLIWIKAWVCQLFLYSPARTREWHQVIEGVAPQLPLTLLNSVLAVCALSSQYFPGRGISPRRMATNVGAMNLVLPLLGGMPMCHGSGGLAALHRFGARTGAAPMALGLAMLVAGIGVSDAAAVVLKRFPAALLAALLLTTAVSLGQAALKPVRGGRALAVCVLIAAAIVVLQSWGRPN